MNTPQQDRYSIVDAALNFGFLAATFIVESETWPVFRAWASQQSTGLSPDFDRGMALELLEELAIGLTVGRDMQQGLR